MRKVMTKLTALIMVTMLMISMSCTPTQVSNAKDVMGKITFYSTMARALITVAENNFADRPKVATALAATKASLATLESALAAVGAGIEKDESKLILAAATLVQNVFVLMNAIREAQSAPRAAVAKPAVP
jgi:hypothetical protein